MKKPASCRIAHRDRAVSPYFRRVVPLLPFVLLSLGSASAGLSNASHQGLPVLTSIRVAHSLTFDQARLGYPVHLRGVVTEYDPDTSPQIGAFFLCQSTGCICVLAPARPVLPIRSGTVVDLRGVTDPGHYAPVIRASEVHAHGQSALPDAPRKTLKQLLTGAYDSRWIEVEGVVHAFKTTAHNATLTLSLVDGTVRAVAPLESGADYSRLIDAKVVLHGNAAPLWNNDRQMIGARLLFPSLAQVKVEEAPPPDPFSYPIRPISSLLTFTPDATFTRRVRVRGTVTLHWPGQWLFIQDGEDGLFVPSAQKGPIEPGSLVDVAGFPAAGEYSSMLEGAIFKVRGAAKEIAAVPVTAQQVMKGGHDAQLVRIRGELVDQDLLTDNPTLALSSNGTFFLALLPPGIDRRAIRAWRTRSELELIGVCSVQMDKSLSSESEGGALPKSFRILLRSPKDVLVLRESSWWTVGRILVVLSISVLVILAGVLWVAALKRRVRERTETIRATLESTAEGILVVDSNHGIIAHNRKFEAMWSVPGAAMRRLDHGRLLDLIKPQLLNPDELACLVSSVTGDALAKTDGAIELRDGRVFELHSEPQAVNGRSVGRVWGFRDVTQLRAQTRQLEDLASMDSLTGLRNRRNIFEFLSGEIQTAKHTGAPITLVMADLDHFKAINDRFGHAAGDAVLKESACRFKSALRKSDAVGRYGGEEFLVVLPGCERLRADSLAELLRSAFEDRPVLVDGKEIRVSCSFGVATAEDGACNMNQLLHDADSALYQAKRAGGNRVSVAEAGKGRLTLVCCQPGEQLA